MSQYIEQLKQEIKIARWEKAEVQREKVEAQRKEVEAQRKEVEARRKAEKYAKLLKRHGIPFD